MEDPLNIIVTGVGGQGNIQASYARAWSSSKRRKRDKPYPTFKGKAVWATNPRGESARNR